MSRKRVNGDKKIECPKCGSGHTIRHAYNVTKMGKFLRLKCQECGSTFYADKNREG